jgi:probable addiction module antidote protein
MKLIDMHEILDSELQDPEYAALYLNFALQDGSPEEFLLALKNVLRANRQMSQVTEKSKLNEENLDQVLSDSDDPHFLAVYKAISSLGFQLSFEPSVS